jgi:hypothetical protein
MPSSATACSVDPAGATATLAAQTGIAVFHVAFGRWVGDDDDDRDLPALIRDSLGELKGLTAESRNLG